LAAPPKRKKGTVVDPGHADGCDRITLTLALVVVFVVLVG
jgi:hypothetical protein